MDPVKKVLSDGKLRLSYGVNGTLPGNYYDYMSLYKYGQYYNGKSGMAIVGIANPNLKWEKNRAFNVGLDLTFIDRISVTFDYYVRTTSDLIYDLPMSAVPGYYDGGSTATTSPIMLVHYETMVMRLLSRAIIYRRKISHGLLC